MSKALITAVVLIASPALPQELPPGHPELPQELPPGHPPLSGEGLGAPKRKPLPLPLPSKSIDPVELLKQLDETSGLKSKEKTFEVAAAMGKLYYAQARYVDAVEYLTQALSKADEMRAFYAAQKKRALEAKKPVPTAAAVGCEPAANASLESMSALARGKAEAGDAAAAVACARIALHPVGEVETMLASAKFITGDPAGALAAHERQLEIFESSPDALYGRGAILLDTRGNDLAALKQAKADLGRFLSEHPTAPRVKQAKVFLARVDEAIAAGGVGALRVKKAAERGRRPPPEPARPPALTQEMIEAVQNTERTPELEAGLAKLLEEAEEHLAKGRFQEALDNYKRVVPFQPENGRAKAGMAWSLVGLNKQPMADQVWRVAVGADPQAVDALGDVLKGKGDAAGAKALWSRLAQSAPAYAPKLGQKTK